MGEHGKAVSDTVRTAKEEYKRNGNDWEKAGQIALRASAGGTIMGTGASIEGTLSAKGSQTNSTGENTTTSTDKGSTENYNNVVKALSGNSWARDNNIDSSYSEGVRESTENVKRAEEQLSISSQKVDDWHKAKSIMESEGAASSTENYQEVVDGIKKEYGVDVKTAQEMASRRTPEAMNVWSKIQKEDHYVENLMNKIASDRQSVSGENAVNRLNEFSNNASNQVSGELSGKIKTQATDNGLNIDQTKSNIKSQEAKLNKQFNKLQNDTDSQYTDGTKKRNLEAVNMSSQVNQNKIIPTQNSSNSKIVDMGFEKGQNIEPSDLSKQINSLKKK